MIILLIIDEFDEKNVFQHLNSKNVFAVATLYQLMSNTKKKIFFKQTNLILIFNSIFYIEKNEIIFWIWLNRFRKNFVLIAEKQQFVFWRTDIVKKKKIDVDFQKRSNLQSKISTKNNQKSDALKTKTSYKYTKKKIKNDELWFNVEKMRSTTADSYQKKIDVYKR